MQTTIVFFSILLRELEKCFLWLILKWEEIIWIGSFSCISIIAISTQREKHIQII